MKLICYDIGSYTLKKAEYLEVKNSLREISWQEFILKGPTFENSIEESGDHLPSDDEENDISKNDALTESDWLDEVIDILKKEKNQWLITDKVILILPEDFSTSRYLEVPVNSKKKAAQILPFQLEDSIPFPLNDVVYQAYYQPGKEKTEVLVNIIGPNDLNNLYAKLDQNQIYFDVITTNIGVLSALSSSKSLSEKNFGVENYAVIDIGHLGTSCFFFHQGKLISNHNSIASGALLTENLADSYNISLEEAQEYKHNEAFFLTSKEQEIADKDEKIFALFMERTFANLITDFSRWYLGYRTKTNTTIDKIFLVGGSSNIQNISPFLEEQFGVECDQLYVLNPKVKLKNTANISSLASVLIYEKQKPLNFLTGKFKARKSSIIPMSASFKLFNRTAFLSLIICFFVLIDLLLNVYSSSKIEKNYKNKLLKNKINITKKQQLTYRKKPERLSPVLTKKMKSIENIKKAVDSVSGNQISSSLELLYGIADDEKLSITNISIKDDIEIILTNIKDVNSLLNKIENSFIISDKKTLNESSLELKLDYLEVFK